MSWEVKPLGEVCELIKRGVSPKYSEAGLMVVNQKCIRNHEINFELARFHDESKKAVNPERLIQVGDVLINSTGTGTLGRTAQVRTDPIHPVTVDTHVTIARPIQSLFYPPYFGYGLVRLEAEFVDSSTGTSGQTELNRKAISENHFICIPPIAEQERIVELLDEAFAAIDKAKANIERNLINARELFQSRLNDIFSNPSEDWEVKPLGEVCGKIQDGAHHSPKQLFSEGGRGRYRYLTSKHIRPMELQWEGSQWCSQEFHETIWPRCNPELGDVLLTKDGSNTGNVCLFSLEEPVSLLSSVCILKANRSIVRPEWILFFILSPMGFKMVTGKMTGAAIRRIILKTIKAAEIAFPGLIEQNDLIEMMFDLHASVVKVESHYQAELNNLEELRQSILEQAFEGKLTEPVAA